MKRQQLINELKNKLSQKSYGSTIEEVVLLRAFKYFDLQNTGLCSKDIFTKTMLKIGITSLSDLEISELFEQFNPNKDGLLDYKEFVSKLYSNKSISSKKKNPEKQIASNIPVSKDIQKNLNKKEFLNQTPVEKILNKIRETLASKGIKEVCSIARYFRIVDENNTQTIDYKEFKKCCEQFKLNLTEDEVKTAFISFDRDNTGEIDYDEFLRTIRGDMNDFRKNLVYQVFNKLDLNGNGEISFDELQAKYSAKSHPEVLSGKKKEEEVLKEFMDTFQDTYNYLCGTETDNIITLEEFMEYYENISMTIDNDEYFETMLNNAWNLNNQNNYKKAWVNKEEENKEEEDYPYINGEGECKYDQKKSMVKVQQFAFVPQNEEEMKKVLYKHGPLAGALNGLMCIFYDKGIYEPIDGDVCPKTINHAVLIVGYGVDKETGKKFWRIKNSMGQDWGEDGYFRILRGENVCGINKYTLIADIEKLN